MYTVKTAAEQMGVCPSVVYELVDAGELPSYRIGKPGRRGTIRIAEGDLEAYLESHKKGESPAAVSPPAMKKKIVLKHLTLKN